MRRVPGVHCPFDGAPVLGIGRGFFHPVFPAASPFCPGRGEQLVRTNHPPILPAVIDRIRCFDNPSIPYQGEFCGILFGFFLGGKA